MISLISFVLIKWQLDTLKILHWIWINISDAVLITRGPIAELYHPSSGTSCMLPTREDDRYYHTLNSGLMCGGYFTGASCVQWSSVNGTWEEYLTMNISRYGHVSWTPDPDMGTYLMGGGTSEARTTTTLINPDGSQELGFSLKYSTMYVPMLWGVLCIARDTIWISVFWDSITVKLKVVIFACSKL